MRGSTPGRRDQDLRVQLSPSYDGMKPPGWCPDGSSATRTNIAPDTMFSLRGSALPRTARLVVRKLSTSAEPYDVVVVGGGPGGYPAAIKAGQLGLRVACIEKRGRLGGTCLNVGCIPSKALLDSSHRYAEAAGHLADHGIGVSGVSLDVAGMMARKDKIVSQLTGGVSGLLKANGVAVITGSAELLAGRQVEVTDASGAKSTHTADNIVLAAGSEPAAI